MQSIATKQGRWKCDVLIYLHKLSGCVPDSMGNIANHLAPKELSLFGNVVMDLTYGTGANLISTSVNKLVMDGAKTRTDMGFQNRTAGNSSVISCTRILDRRGISVSYM